MMMVTTVQPPKSFEKPKNQANMIIIFIHFYFGSIQDVYTKEMKNRNVVIPELPMASENGKFQFIYCLELRSRI